MGLDIIPASTRAQIVPENETHAQKSTEKVNNNRISHACFVKDLQYPLNYKMGNKGRFWLRNKTQHSLEFMFRTVSIEEDIFIC